MTFERFLTDRFGPAARPFAPAKPARPTAPVPAAGMGIDSFAAGASAAGPARPDPALVAVFEDMARAMAGGGIAAAHEIRERALSALPGDPQAARLAFERARACHAYATGGARPVIGADHNLNPYHTAPVETATQATDLTAVGQAAGQGATAALGRMAARGYSNMRTELWVDFLPPPGLASAYEVFRQDGRFPYGRTPADFRKALAAKPLQTALARRGIALDPADRAALAADRLPGSLVYLEATAAQLAAIRRASGPGGGQATADIVVKLGDGLSPTGEPGTAGRFERPAPGSPAQTYVDGIAARTRWLAARACDAGITSFELDNEPNLSEDGAFWTPNPQEPRSITNHARRFAYLEGEVYRALKADPTLTGLQVDMAAMAFTNPLPADSPFYPLETVDARMGTLLPGGRPEEAQALSKLAADALAAEARGDSPAVFGYFDAMFAVHDQVHARRNPGADPNAPHHNDAFYFLGEVHAAQREFFDLPAGAGLLTDRTNIHLYGSPVRDAALLKRYGELADAGVLPRGVVLSEFGSRFPEPIGQAIALFGKAADHAQGLRAVGLVPEKVQTFSFHGFEGWGVGDNPAYDGTALGAPPPRPRPAPSAPGPVAPTPARPAPGTPPGPLDALRNTRLWRWLSGER